MSKITYTDKVTLNENPNVADVNKVKADDLNEIKNVVNANADNLATKQATLVSGTNIKTINNESILGSGNLDILNMVYPVGSIYMSVNSTSPANFLGGTWERIKGRCIVGVDENDADFNTVSKTGGSKYLQQHEHAKTTGLYKYEYSNGIDGQVYKGAPKLQDVTVWSGKVADVTTGNSGNLQPYYTAYIWRRTA